MFFVLFLLAAEVFARKSVYIPKPIRLPITVYRPTIPTTIYDAEDTDDKLKINLDEIAKIAGQTQQIIQILKSDDEDLENGLFKSIGKFFKKVGRGVTHALPAVVDAAGKVAEIGKVLGFDAEDVENKLKSKYGLHSRNWYLPGQNPLLKDLESFFAHTKNLNYDAEDMDDNIFNTIVDIAGKVATIGGILGFEAEDIEDKIKFNPSKIVEIAGKINQIGQVLGYDAEDADDSLTFAAVCGIIGAASTLIKTGQNIYEHIKGDDQAELLAFDAEDVDDNIFNTIVDIAGKVASIGGILGFDAEDVENTIKMNIFNKFPRRIYKRAPLVIA